MLCYSILPSQKAILLLIPYHFTIPSTSKNSISYSQITMSTVYSVSFFFFFKELLKSDWFKQYSSLFFSKNIMKRSCCKLLTESQTQQTSRYMARVKHPKSTYIRIGIILVPQLISQFYHNFTTLWFINGKIMDPPFYFHHLQHSTI